jgi:hypothetical protein
MLAQNRNAYIGQCTGCLDYSFAYKNLLFTFTEEQLGIFCDWLTGNIHNPNFFFDLPHGKNRVYRSPVDNLCFAFREDELVEIAELFTEARVLMEINKVLYGRERS